jgi:hypothetical protein
MYHNFSVPYYCGTYRLRRKSRESDPQVWIFHGPRAPQCWSSVSAPGENPPNPRPWYCADAPPRPSRKMREAKHVSMLPGPADRGSTVAGSPWISFKWSENDFFNLALPLQYFADISHGFGFLLWDYLVWLGRVSPSPVMNDVCAVVAAIWTELTGKRSAPSVSSEKLTINHHSY